MAETKIDIREMVASVIMEEVNNLGVRAAVKEKVQQVGELTKDEVRTMVQETIDSYVRSIDVEKIIKEQVKLFIDDTVAFRVREAIAKYINGSIFSPTPTKQLEDIILNDLKKQFYEKYNLKVVNTKENRSYD